MRKHSFVAKAGLILPLLVLCVCAFGFLLAPNDPDLVDLTKKFLSPCSEFPLGTDNLGRCVLSRLLYGGRTTLGIVLVGSVTVSVLGTLAGLLMGGGKNGKNLILEGGTECGHRNPAHRLPDHFYCRLGQQRVHYGSGGVGLPDAAGHQAGPDTDRD